MERVGKLRASLLVAIAIAAGLTVTLLLVTRSSNASGGSALVKTAHNATLGMPGDLEAARRGARRDADRRQGPRRRQAAGHATAGRLPRRAALPLR